MEHFIWEEDNEGKKQLSNIQTATPWSEFLINFIHPIK